jgi:hypothetical protein
MAGPSRPGLFEQTVPDGIGNRAASGDRAVHGARLGAEPVGAVGEGGATSVRTHKA